MVETERKEFGEKNKKDFVSSKRCSGKPDAIYTVPPFDHFLTHNTEAQCPVSSPTRPLAHSPENSQWQIKCLGLLLQNNRRSQVSTNRTDTELGWLLMG